MMTGALEVKVKELRAFTNELANRFDEKSRLASLVPFFGRLVRGPWPVRSSSVAPAPDCFDAF